MTDKPEEYNRLKVGSGYGSGYFKCGRCGKLTRKTSGENANEAYCRHCHIDIFEKENEVVDNA